ncbi:DUF4129 domain-containing protein [Flavobacterium sp. LC2016-01]|uniref:DUF4129 domain-containing protein n=1 Tax=Flavobacterium sp. LC2016-01 TaxID=2675876 RepID=UPI0012BA5EB4|nr:DUF4129 domain-containing protein [Flavobacterium sp. LC2016-01]MTH14082.1 DUF4129 domain-containing protein [Flavobacterium sp. LC2016-01]
MNKIFFILLFVFCCSFSNAQDSLVTEEPPKIASIKYTEKDIQVDSAAIPVKTFKKDFKENYKGSDFVYETKPPEKTFWDDFMEWLASIFRRIFTFSNPEASVNFIAILFKTLAAIIIIVVIFLIVKALINKDGQWIFGKNSQKRTIYYSDTEKNIHLLDFEKLIKENIESDQKRIAIRYYYLWLLKVMAQNHYIEWDIEKTNSDYLYEIQSPIHKEEFTYLSYLYNYIWYGEFDINTAIFLKAENRFKNAIKTFSHE